MSRSNVFLELIEMRSDSMSSPPRIDPRARSRRHRADAAGSRRRSFVVRLARIPPTVLHSSRPQPFPAPWADARNRRTSSPARNRRLLPRHYHVRPPACAHRFRPPTTLPGANPGSTSGLFPPGPRPSSPLRDDARLEKKNRAQPRRGLGNPSRGPLLPVVTIPRTRRHTWREYSR